jgi:hypothetical protein
MKCKINFKQDPTGLVIIEADASEHQALDRLGHDGVLAVALPEGFMTDNPVGPARAIPELQGQAARANAAEHNFQVEHDRAITAEQKLAEVERDLGDWQLRLAGALMAAEGSTSTKTIATAVETVRTCPTIQAVLRLRQDRDDLRDALGKAEQEIIRIKTRPPGTNKKSKSKPLSRSKKVPGRRAPSGRSRKKTTRKRLAAVRQ